MLNMRFLLRGAAAAALALVIAFTVSSSAADILDDWASVKAPPPPELKPAMLEGPTTALLIMDMGKMTCSRPSCVAMIPNVKRLHDAVEAAGGMVWYALTGQATAADYVDPTTLPREGEWEIRPGPDKFLDSDLDARLKAHKIKTVIVCGVSFQGVGVGTATEAAERGYKVIVPIDCLSSDDLYAAQYSAWHLSKSGPGSVTRAVTLTRSTMVKF
jgi:nicotinamidase-related amidase